MSGREVGLSEASDDVVDKSNVLSATWGHDRLLGSWHGVVSGGWTLTGPRISIVAFVIVARACVGPAVIGKASKRVRHVQ